MARPASGRLRGRAAAHPIRPEVAEARVWPGPETPVGRLAGGAKLGGFGGLTLPLIPVQAALVRLHRASARRFPNWYHRQVCRLLGVRLHIDGQVEPNAPVLLIANHKSWLDIPVLSAVAPVSFVAKKEVGGWPGVGALARLQRTVFVDRQRRIEHARGLVETPVVEHVAAALHDRVDAVGIALEHAVVLFAEGTSTDGNRVLAFKTSLFAAAKPTRTSTAPPSATRILAQTVTIAYTHLHGLPLGRADRHLTRWYGDMDIVPHAWSLLRAGPLDVTVSIGPPVPLDEFPDRKALARHSEEEIRRELVRILHRRPRTKVTSPAPAPPTLRAY